jgi:uncharacterized protein (DUF1501 family)
MSNACEICCPTTRSERGPSRRSVLRAAGATAALGIAGAAAGEATAVRYAFAAPSVDPAPDPGDVLVVVSLRGGFDGLSAVVPAGDPNYARLRPGVAIPASRLLPLDATFGLHPAMSPLLPFWQNGSLGIVHAVGQADASRSHFAAMAEMERAAPGSALRTGWLDRLVGLAAPTSVFHASQVGRNGLLGSLTGPSPELVISSIDDFTLNAAWNSIELARWSTALSTMHRTAAPTLARPAGGALTAMATTSRLKAEGYTPAGGASYPNGELGRSLRDVARLIKAGVGLRVACVDYGDWDLHAAMGTVDAGNMTDRLTELAGALAAFATDLGDQAMAGVSLVTLSEFGRRVAENGSGGTDHGHGNAVLLLGGGMVGGRVYGDWPGLDAAALEDGDLAGRVDYRALLAEILRDRCGVGAIGTVFPRLAWGPLGITRPRA